MPQDIQETRICVQQILPMHHQELQKLKSSGFSQHQVDRLSASFWTKKVWPKGARITIGFLDTGKQIPKTSTSQLTTIGNGKLDPLQNQVDNMEIQQMIKKIVRERLEPLVNLRLEFVDQNPESANVRISFDPNGGAWSLVGTDHLHQPTGATMNLGWFDVPTCIHEFCHMLGMIHEHQSPRGQKIQWNDKKVYEWARATQGWSDETTYQNILSKYDISTINGSEFDPLSVMLYFFPADLTLNGVGTQQNLRMSGLDVDWLYKIYTKDKGETPTQFYQDVYNDSLQKSVEDSKRLARAFGGSAGQLVIHTNWKTIGVTLAIVIGIVLIVGVLYWLIVKKRMRSGRYGRR
jgi:hypothetical protein